MNVVGWLYERAQRAGERGPEGPRIDAGIASPDAAHSRRGGDTA
jgi:hypothetical protein